MKYDYLLLNQCQMKDFNTTQFSPSHSLSNYRGTNYWNQNVWLFMILQH